MKYLSNTNAHKKSKLIFVGIIILFLFISCAQEQGDVDNSESWQTVFENRLPLLGHRNWILIVDKAFPLQNGNGIEVVYTNERLLPVLSHVLSKIENTDHVKPIIYTDKELEFLNPTLVSGVDTFKNKLNELIKNNRQTILHDSVFLKIDNASKLFRILVLKTDEIIPYSSVFLELDCKYWSAKKENKLRELMGATK